MALLAEAERVIFLLLMDATSRKTMSPREGQAARSVSASVSAQALPAGLPHSPMSDGYYFIF